MPSGPSTFHVIPTVVNNDSLWSCFTHPRQEGPRRRCWRIVKWFRRHEDARNTTLRAAYRGFRTASRAAYDAPASLRTTLLAGNLDRPSQWVIINDRWYYLAQYEYRFNRRYRLEDMIPRLAWVALRTPPMPYRLLKLAELSA